MLSHRTPAVRTHWVVWLCVAVWLALVPLRSWAQVTMPLAATAATAAASAAPCHDAAATDDSAAPSHSLCADCALCHAVAAPAPGLLVSHAAPAATHWQQPHSAAPAARALDTPFKPPRA